MRKLDPVKKTSYGYTGSYELDFSISDKYNSLLVCYILAKSADLHDMSVEIKSEKLVSYNQFDFIDRFPNEELLCKSFSERECAWRITFEYNSARISVNGVSNSVIIDVVVSIGHFDKCYNILRQIEFGLFKYHPFDERVVNMVRSFYNKSDYKTFSMLFRVYKNKAIFDEFLRALNDNVSDPICIYGHTANQIMVDYDKSLPDAYLFLYYFSIDSKHANNLLNIET